MPASAVFFDLDGCLVDSTAAITACVDAALRAAGLPPRGQAALTWCVGPPLLDSFARLLTEAGDDPARAPALVQAYRAVYPDVARRRTRVIEGVPALLRDLHGAVPLAVVTSKPVAFAAPLLRGLGLASWFSGMYAPALHAPAERKEVTLLRALEATGAGRAVMIGDRSHDVEAGRACGTATIGVTWGAGCRAELEAAGADAVVDTPEDLAALLAGVGRFSQRLPQVVGGCSALGTGRCHYRASRTPCDEGTGGCPSRCARSRSPASRTLPAWPP